MSQTSFAGKTGADGLSDKGPFKKDVTAKLAIFDPPSLPCHHLSLILCTSPPSLVTGQIVTNFFSVDMMLKRDLGSHNGVLEVY